MSDTTHTASPPLEIDALEVLVTNLRNAHALEKQVVAVLETQLKNMDDYPDLHARVSQHVFETREQTRRLESALELCGESPSMIKDAMLSAMGMSQSAMQGFSDDAVLKAVTADMMTEHLEIATYRTLITLAEMAGKSELLPRLEESLREEEAMAAWFDENLEPITQRFVELKAAERQAVVEKEAEAAERQAEQAAERERITSADGKPEMTLYQQLENAEQFPAHPHSKPKRAADASEDDTVPTHTTQTSHYSSKPTVTADDTSGPSSPAILRPKI